MSTEILVTRGRRSWPIELKRQILWEAAQPGATICAVAKAYDIDPAQLYQWRKKFLIDPPMQEADRPAFLPIEINGTPAPELNDSSGACGNRSGHAEIAFPDGVHLFIPVDLERALTDRLIAAVKAA